MDVKTLALLLALGTSLSSAAAPPSAAEDPVIEVSLLDLMSIDYTPGKRLPAWVRALSGRRVRMEGFMALGTPEGEERFELVWDSCGCGQSNVHHFVDVSLTEGTPSFNPDLLWVEGEFSAGEIRRDGFVVSLFRLKTKSIDG